MKIIEGAGREVYLKDLAAKSVRWTIIISMVFITSKQKKCIKSIFPNPTEEEAACNEWICT